jgi:biopolymer transport protein ExbD
MARSRIFATSHEEDSTHGNRPWVYFMIDAFFLVTQFFVLTFHVKADEKVLPQQLPPGISKPTPDLLTPATTLPVHVMRNGAGLVYRVQATNVSLEELESALQRSAGAGLEYTVRVSYEASVPFGDVLAVFNASSKAGLKRCGLVPLRQSGPL